MRRFLFALSAALFLYIPQNSFAWGQQGHRIVGKIADSYLTETARKNIQNIIPFESVAMISTWADFIKSDSTFKYLDTWHYVNLQPGLTAQAFNDFFAQDTSVTLYTKLNFIINEFKTNKLLANDQKVMYLKLLVHMVGDLHQPMHLGRPDDRGGNAVRVNWFRDASNLHRVWDENLISFQELSYTEYAEWVNNIPKEKLEFIKNRTMLEHIWDTYQVTQKIYAETIPNDRLGYDYNYRFVGDLNDQLLKGGIHLAMILNDIFGA